MIALANHPPHPSTIKLAPRRLSPSDKETTRVLPRNFREALDHMARCVAVVVQLEAEMEAVWTPGIHLDRFRTARCRVEERRLRALRDEALENYEAAKEHANTMKTKDNHRQLNRAFKLLSYTTTEHY